MVRRNAYNRPVFIVQGFRFERKSARHITLPLKWYVGCCVQLRTRVFGQGMEKQAINDNPNAPKYKDLKKILLVSHETDFVMLTVWFLMSVK